MKQRVDRLHLILILIPNLMMYPLMTRRPTEAMDQILATMNLLPPREQWH